MLLSKLTEIPGKVKKNLPIFLWDDFYLLIMVFKGIKHPPIYSPHKKRVARL